MDITTLMELGGGNLKLEVTVENLHKFAQDVVEQTLSAKSKALTGTKAAGETWLNTRQVCEKLGIAKSTLWLWQKRGYITPKKVGGHNRYSMTDVLRLITQGEVKSEAEQDQP